MIVATRLSLSFPLLIAAVPLMTIDWRDQATHDAHDQYREARAASSPPPSSGIAFQQVWFTDGGFCSNFPVHLFDTPLASRPTFAINLGRFPTGREPAGDQRQNVEWARNNRRLPAPFDDIPTKGVAALSGFASAAINTSRNWQDGSQLDHPGFRDRIVRVLHSKREGGLNLHMDAPTIDQLAERGQVAAEAIVDQFTAPHYPERGPAGATGWDNHRWVRYRALLSVLPGWLRSYRNGKTTLGIDPSAPRRARPRSGKEVGPYRCVPDQGGGCVAADGRCSR